MKPEPVLNQSALTMREVLVMNEPLAALSAATTTLAYRGWPSSLTNLAQPVIFISKSSLLSPGIRLVAPRGRRAQVRVSLSLGGSQGVPIAIL